MQQTVFLGQMWHRNFVELAMEERLF